MELRPFNAADLAGVEPWFDDPETQRWLGGREWPAQLLKLSANDAKRNGLLAIHDNRPVCLIDVERHADGRAGVAIVTAPDARRQGLAAGALRALPGLPTLSAMTELFAGVEQGNEASERLLRAAGFRQVSELDDEGFFYFAFIVSGDRISLPWRLPQESDHEASPVRR